MKKSASEIAKISMCVCIAAVLSQVSIPFSTGVPLTLQTFAIAFCGWFLGLKRGLVALLCYLAASAAGVPVFSGLKAGIGVFAGATGGFLYGFTALVISCGLALAIENKARKKAITQLTVASDATADNGKNFSSKISTTTYIAVWGISLLGLIVCHVCGVFHYCIVTGVKTIPAILSISLPYLPKDIISVVGAYFIARAINSRLKKTQTV